MESIFQFCGAETHVPEGFLYGQVERPGRAAAIVIFLLRRAGEHGAHTGRDDFIGDAGGSSPNTAGRPALIGQVERTALADDLSRRRDCAMQ